MHEDTSFVFMYPDLYPDPEPKPDPDTYKRRRSLTVLQNATNSHHIPYLTSAVSLLPGSESMELRTSAMMCMIFGLKRCEGFFH